MTDVALPGPAVVALVGRLVVHCYADKNPPGRHSIEWSLAWAPGAVGHFLWSRWERGRTFGENEKEMRKEMSQEYLRGADPDAAAVGVRRGRRTAPHLGA